MNLEKPTLSLNKGVDNINDTVNNIINDASSELSIEMNEINTLPNDIDMEKVREAERQAEESVNETLNSTLQSVQGTVDYINNGLDAFCNDDGTPVVSPANLKLKPVYSALLAIILPGIPQLINGQTQKGLIIFIGAFIINILACVFCVITIPLISTLSAIDAYKCAKKLSEGKSLTKLELGF